MLTDFDPKAVPSSGNAECRDESRGIFLLEVSIFMIFPEQSAAAARTRFGFDPAAAGPIID